MVNLEKFSILVIHLPRGSL